MITWSNFASLLVNTPLNHDCWFKSLLEVIATADQMKRTVSLSQLVDFSVLNAAGDIWDNVSTHLNKIYNKGLVVF